MKIHDVVQSGTPIVRLSFNNPKVERSPYLGFIVTFARELNTRQVYGRLDREGNTYSDSMTVEARFHAQQADIRSHVLSHEEKLEHCKLAAQPCSDWEVLAILLSLRESGAADIYGDRWPGIPRTGESKIVFDGKIPSCMMAKEWTIFLKRLPKYGQNLQKLRILYAEKGKGLNFGEYLVDPRRIEEVLIVCSILIKF